MCLYGQTTYRYIFPSVDYTGFVQLPSESFEKDSRGQTAKS